MLFFFFFGIFLFDSLLMRAFITRNFVKMLQIDQIFLRYFLLFKFVIGIRDLMKIDE